MSYRGMTVYKAVSDLTGGRMDGVLGALQGGRVLEMYETVPGDDDLLPLTLSHEEGRRIYERSLRFVLLLAVRRQYPGQRVRIEFSAGNGIFVQLPGQVLGKWELEALREEMRRIVLEDLPFTRRVWSLADAIRYFEEDGQPDKVELLRRRSFDYFRMYSCGGMWEYFYGTMAPSTGYVPVFDLVRESDGFMLVMPDEEDPSRPAVYDPQKKLIAVFRQSAQWCEILGVRNASNLADMVEQERMRSFIRVNEILHTKALAGIAEDIVAKGKRIVLLAGPSSSGKTTSARRLCMQLQALGKHPVLVSLDNFYRDRSEMPVDEFGERDFESLYALDLERLQRDVLALLTAGHTELPEFDFTQGRQVNSGKTTYLEEGQPLIFEGIHALNPELLPGIPDGKIYRIYVSALACLNLDDHNRIRSTDARLLRRIVRDYAFRGTRPEGTLAMWDSVRRGEKKWIQPYEEGADAVINTTLHYELGVLKGKVFDLLSEIPPESACYLPARRLIKILNYIPEIPEELLDEIPPTSLLREFIGGSTFEEQG